MARESNGADAAPAETRLIKVGESGHVISGQYLTLPHGEYMVDFALALIGDADASEDTVAILDVVADWGNIRLACQEVKAADLSAEPRILRLEFSLPTTQTVEFRVESTGNAQMAAGRDPILGYRYAPMVSFAHAREDIYLWRALAPRVHHDVGFWIDAGAFDPVTASVTKAFYDRGWRGINIEPLQGPYQRLTEQRPRDINLQLLVSDVAVSETFYELDNGQLSTTNEEFAQRHIASGSVARSYVVQTTTLADICAQYAPQDIHFLKIDVEGHEAKAIAGMDFSRFRPWILVIEATEPNCMDRPTHGEWEHLISAAGYDFVLSDLPNRYYVAHERPELKDAFTLPADVYVPFDQLHTFRSTEERIAALNDRIRELERELATAKCEVTTRKAGWLRRN